MDKIKQKKVQVFKKYIFEVQVKTDTKRLTPVSKFG